MDKRGVIFDMNEFAVFDGPGIRTSVFLKGCPLRCAWCHNPEGFRKKPELLVSKNGCLKCNACTEVCAGTPETCTLCKRCIRVCPLHLRRVCGEELTSSNLVRRILKNKALYEETRGGVTFTGGEPLMQADFLEEVVLQLPGIHKAIETSGFARSSDYIRVVEQMDFVFQDIKFVDSTLHKKYTGKDNYLILENVESLKQMRKPFIIRIPLVPGVNDTYENIEQIAELLVEAKFLLRVELLPYHKTAGAKYEMLGRSYEPEFDENQIPVFHQESFVLRNIPYVIM